MAYLVDSSVTPERIGTSDQHEPGFTAKVVQMVQTMNEQEVQQHK